MFVSRYVIFLPAIELAVACKALHVVWAGGRWLPHEPGKGQVVGGRERQWPGVLRFGGRFLGFCRGSSGLGSDGRCEGVEACLQGREGGRHGSRKLAPGRCAALGGERRRLRRLRIFVLFGGDRAKAWCAMCAAWWGSRGCWGAQARCKHAQTHEHALAPRSF